MFDGVLFFVGEPQNLRWSGWARRMPTQTRAFAALRRRFLPPRSRPSLPAGRRRVHPDPAPSSRVQDDDGSSSSDDGGPPVYTAPRPASTLGPGQRPLIGRPGRAIFGCGFSLACAWTCVRARMPAVVPQERRTANRRRGAPAIAGQALRRLLVPRVHPGVRP
jgi:hypothetical protein